MNAVLRASSRGIVLGYSLEASRTDLGTLVFCGACEAVRVAVRETLGRNLTVPALTTRYAGADQGVTETALAFGGAKDARQSILARRTFDVLEREIRHTEKVELEKQGQHD